MLVPTAAMWTLSRLSEAFLARKQDTYILDAGLDNGIELPYTCRGGICGCAERCLLVLDLVEDCCKHDFDLLACRRPWLA